MKGRALSIAVIGAAFLSGQVPAVAAAYRARRTFIADKGTPNPFGRSDVLAADFLTTGFAAPDGSDIAVLAGPTGRLTDFKVMMIGPGDRARIAIRMLPGVKEYHVSYGGSKPSPSRWEPDVGLVLETRGFKGGDVRTLEMMRRLVQTSAPSYGTWFVPNIFQGTNPFGPSDDYVSIYRGWLHVPKAGAYTFATTSDDASYFLVDDKVVASMPRWGRGPADARFAGAPVNLEAGAHRIEYLHVEGRETQFCVAAWQPPGEERFQVIPPDAFPGVFKAKQTALVIPGAPLPIDLLVAAEGEVIFEEHHLYRVKFRDATPDGQSAAWAPKWFFGDGTSSDERDPEHIYFLPGEYEVTFALIRGSAAARIRQRILVGANWEINPTSGTGDTSARYYELVKGYDFNAMHSPDLKAALEFFLTLGKDAEVMKTAAALLARNDAIARKNIYHCAVLLGERLRDLQQLPKDALVVFRSALVREPDDANKAKLIRRIGDTLLYVLGKPDEALAEYNTILDRFAKLEDNVVRLAQIRVGDAWKAKGDREKSLAAYEKAATMRTWDRTHAVNSVRRGAFAQSIESHIHARQLGEAQSLLDIWGWEHPTDRLAGEWSLAVAKLAKAKGDKGAAAREALECANANKSGPLADQLLLFAGQVVLEDGRPADALALAQRIRTDYPESAYQEDAALLECQSLLADKKPREAAKAAAEAYTRFRGAAAPLFLTIAADAALALNDKPRAVELLRLIVKDHPRTEEAEKAAAKLKALGGN